MLHFLHIKNGLNVLLRNYFIKTPLFALTFVLSIILLVVGCKSAVMNQAPNRVKPIATATTDYPKELKPLHDNLIAFYLAIGIDTSVVNNRLKEINADGSWPDIDYSITARGNWPVLDHLDYLQFMAIAYKTKESPYYQKEDVKKKIHSALDLWLQKDYLSENWWDQHIGVPEALLPTILLIENELTEKQINSAMVLFDRAKIKMTGQNKIWLSGNVMMKSLLNRNADSVAIASKSIQDELVTTEGEGIQFDWSYHQHGSQLQFGNYGLSYLEDMIKWYTILNDTPFAFENTKKELLRNYILEGQRWVLWKDRIDISALGRQIFIDERSKKSKRLKAVMHTMERLDEPYAETYKDATDYSTLKGDKHFWASDFHVKRTEDYYFSVKMNSSRVLGAESVNGENVQGYHMGDGVAFLYQDSDDYVNVFPFWNWRRLPGTTVVQDTVPLPVLTAWGYQIDSDFVGGVSNGENGIAVMDYRRDGVQARKSWFMFNDKIVCLGSGITSSKKLPVNTTIEQNFLKGEVQIDKNENVSDSAKKNLKDPNWILHDRKGYLFPKGGNIRIDARYLEGTWANVLKRARPVILTERIFTLWFDHGAAPNNVTYEYLIVPNADEQIMNNLKQNPAFETVNTSKLQTVISKDGMLGGAVFYVAGQAAIFGGIEVDKPCVLIVHKEKEGIKVSLSDPTQQLTEILLTINGSFNAQNAMIQKGGSTRLKIQLPTGTESGKSVSFQLKRLPEH